jgi:hypothetical protein
LGIGRRYSRLDTQNLLDEHGIPYLVTTQCDGCPNKDVARWQRTSADKLDELAAFEAQFNGEFFLTNTLLPLRQGIAALGKRKERNGGASLFDSCDGGYCFV